MTTNNNDGKPVAGELCLLCCHNYRPELEAAIAAEGWIDVSVVSFRAMCGHPQMSWDELRPLLPPQCTQAVLLGRACLNGLENTPEGWPPLKRLHLRECFDLLAGASMVEEAVARGAYLVTPGWLDDWRGDLRELGFDGSNVADFFRDSARELVLLDTGVAGGAAASFAELASVAGLPATRVAVGLDHVRLLLARVVAEWRLADERRQAERSEHSQERARADYISAMDFLAQLALLKDEPQTIAAIEDMFRMLFAPRDLGYVRLERGAPLHADHVPRDLARQVAALQGNWAWTDSGTGFLLRISWAGETLGIVAADHFAFPEFRDHYLNLALSAASACGLAIENARIYLRITEAEEALRRNEHSLRMAQSIAHLGHWEWDVETERMTWSEETYRILGYTPQAHLPSREKFLEVIHPDDRARVARHIEQATRAGGGFDVEYRIVPPDGRVRFVHGMGEVLAAVRGRPPQIIGAIRDITEQEMMEVMGVIQDITERKQLELKLAEEAHTDALTGCANRRYFLKLAATELTRERRYGGGLSVCMIDIDHFKSVNDRHGHHAGDLALQKLVQVCRATLREEDAIGRLGGEEFAVLLPETGRDRALEVAERLRQAVAAAEVPLEHKPPLRVTISVGVTTVSAEDSGMDAVLDRADQALYQAKNAGRNRVAAAPA